MGKKRRHKAGGFKLPEEILQARSGLYRSGAPGVHEDQTRPKDALCKSRANTRKARKRAAIADSAGGPFRVQRPFPQGTPAPPN